MAVHLGVIMDPLHDIKIQKDTTVAMLQEAQQQEWKIFYMEQQDLYLENGVCMATMYPIEIDLTRNPWYQLKKPINQPLSKLQAILMRKDPPFDMEYIYTTYLLEIAEAAGTLIVNRPQALRDANEKLFINWFPQCCPPTLVAKRAEHIREFIQQHGEVIIKPLEGMGGFRIFRTNKQDPNLSVILETMTDYGKQFTMVQKFIPEITQGDKRVIVIDGEPMPYMLARIPKPGETRGNLAAGASAQILPLGEREKWICGQIGKTLSEKGLLFVGVDIIGDYLTEINVTSPTGIREIEAVENINISKKLFEKISDYLQRNG